MIQICVILLDPKHRHVALLGTGGIGKSSIAKAILNDPRITVVFKGRLFFIRFDDILTSQITYATFVDRVARTLGVPSSGSHSSILEHLARERILLVFDNAETFLDPKAQDTSRIKAAIDEFGGFSTVSILLTSRSREVPHALRCEKVDIPNLDAEPAYDVFTEIYRRNVLSSRPILENLLSSVGYHPLSITLLAQAAEVNEWAIEELNRRWDARHTELLKFGQGKDENLAASIELSLGSPCIHTYGDNVRHIMHIIAFFPQGVLREKLAVMFPSIPQIQDIVDVLHRQSIILFRGEFVTMLTPIRLYTNETIPTPDLLDAARNHYYSALSQELNQVGELIETEDVNIESLLAFDLKTLPPSDLEDTLDACESFIYLLLSCKARPVSLVPSLLAIDTSHSRPMTLARLGCFIFLSSMAKIQNSYAEAANFQEFAQDLAQKADDKPYLLRAILEKADTRVLLGQYRAAQQLLESSQFSEAWTVAGVFEKGRLASIRADMKQCTDTQITGVSLAELYREAEDFEASTDSKAANISRRLAAFSPALIENNTRASRATGKLLNLELAQLALVEGSLEEAERFLNLARASFQKYNHMPLATSMLLFRAILAMMQGNLDGAKSLIEQGKEESKNHTFLSHDCQWLSLYTSAALELVSGRLVEAGMMFERTQKYCEAQDEFHVRAVTLRAMGEVAYLQQDTERARSYFEQTVKICEEAGIVPALLYRRYNSNFSGIFYSIALPVTCHGWLLFLQGNFLPDM